LLLPAALVDLDWLGADRRAAAAAMPAWAAIARRSRLAREAGPDDPPPSDPGHERWLRERLCLPAGCALAACAAAADHLDDVAWRIDPVHLHVGRDHLVMTEPAGLALAADDAVALAASIAPLFDDDGLELVVPGGPRWYLRERSAERPLRLRTRPLSGASGRNVDAWMPTGDDARRWRRLLNEVQMTWHAHPVNAARAERGLPPVNSLWIDGRCPGAADRQGAAADTAARIALRAPMPPGGFALDDGPLLIDHRLLDAQHAGDPSGWRDAWRAVNDTLLAPIARGDALWSNGGRLVLTGDAGWRELALRAGAGWRFWHRPDPVALLAEPAAPVRTTP
ncbi:MAG: hypothetical protein ACOYLX_11035, partial [Burkholderiaceae bacterium]